MAVSTVDPTSQPKLRFQVGDRIFCKMKGNLFSSSSSLSHFSIRWISTHTSTIPFFTSDVWEPSTVIKLWWCEPEEEFYGEDVLYHPYQALPDRMANRKQQPKKTNLFYPDGAIYVPSDTNDCVRRIPVDEFDEILAAIECGEDTEYIVEELIYDRKIDVVNEDDFTFSEKMAFTAVEYSHTSILSWLHSQGMPFELYKNDKNANLLHVAIQLNKLDVIECLFNLLSPCSAIYNGVDQRGYTILHYMVLYFTNELVACFDFDLNARFKDIYTKEDHNGRTAITIAQAMKKTEMETLLKKNFSCEQGKKQRKIRVK